MATAPALAYSGPAGSTIYGGRAASGLRGTVTLDALLASGAISSQPSALTGTVLLDDMLPSGSLVGYDPPAYVLATNVDEWGTIPNSVINTSAAWRGDIFQSWCGAVINTVGLYDGATFIPGTFWVMQSGGHTIDFDEIYAFGPLESNDTSVRKWRCIRERTVPSIVNQDENGAGTPVSGHSYASMVYDPVLNIMWRIGIAFRYSDAQSNVHIYGYRFGVASPNVNQPWIKKTVTLTSPAYTATIDLAQRRVYFHPQSRNEVAMWDIDTDTLTTGFGKTPNPGDDTAGSAYDSTRGLWLNIGNGYSLYRTNNGVANDYYTPTIASGTPPSMGTNFYGVPLYDPDDDRFVVWMSGNKRLDFLKAPATNPYQGGNGWTWSNFTPAGGSTPQAPPNYGVVGSMSGTFGRFARHKFSGGQVIYLCMNSVSNNIDFYRRA